MTFEEKIKKLEQLDKYQTASEADETAENEKQNQIETFENALKSAEKVVRTIQDGLSKVKLGDEQEEIDRFIELALANEDSAFIEIGKLSSVHSDPKGGEEFAQFSDSDLPGIGLFKDSDEEYRLVLPQFRSIQYRRTSEYKSIGISELVKECCAGYEKRTGIKLVPTKNYTRITITNYLKKFSSEAVDPGNMDCKAAIDALQGILIEGDSINDIEVLCRGKISPDNKSYTEIKITKMR